MYVKKALLAGLTGVLWGVMYRACHIVSVHHVFVQATSFNCPTWEAAEPNRFLQIWQQRIPAGHGTEFASEFTLPRCYMVKWNDVPDICT